MQSAAMDGGNNSYRRNFLIQRSGNGRGRGESGGRGARREGKLDFANFETEPSDGPPDRPNNQRRSDSDRQYDCCEVEIRGCRGEDE